MDGKNQPKTKAELLRELQSIQQLLDEQPEHAEDRLMDELEDEDIPLLDEFMPDDTDQDELDDESLEADTLNALNAAYAALTQEPESADESDDQWLDEDPSWLADEPHSEEDDHETPPQQPAQPTPAAAAPTARTDAPQNAAQKHPTPAVATADAEQRSDESAYRQQPEARHRQGVAGTPEGLTSAHTDPAAPAPLPGQQSLFDGPRSGDHARSAAASERPPAKARGENPFLPQHIRERLRGNQVLPKGDFLQPTTRPAHHDLPSLPEKPAAKKPPVDDVPAMVSETESPDHGSHETAAEATEIDTEAMLDELVAAALPDLEKKLRAAFRAALEKDQTPPH